MFSKLDIIEAYGHVKLDDRLSMLTTVITPFGRYRWSKLPFGLKVSSEIFQRKLTDALGDIEGVFTKLMISLLLDVEILFRIHQEKITPRKNVRNHLLSCLAENEIRLFYLKKENCSIKLKKVFPATPLHSQVTRQSILKTFAS